MTESEKMLSERALLATVTIRQWGGRKLDRKVTESATDEHNAARDAGRFNKLLLPAEAFAKITKAISAAKAFHYARTLPWHDSGARIISAAGLLDYQNGLRKIKSEFAAAVAEFLAAYPGYVAAAPARLGDMFDAADFPDVSEIARRFSMDFYFVTVPDSRDFRVELAAGQAEAIKADMEHRVRDALAGAMFDAFKRVSETVGRMAEKLAAYQPGSGTKADPVKNNFHASLVENVRELAGLLPALNLTGDSRLNALAADMRKLCEFTAAELKDSDNARAKIAAEAARVAETARATVEEIGATLADYIA